MTEHICIKDPVGIIAVVETLIGYRPTNNLALGLCDQHNRIVVTTRIDLGDLTNPELLPLLVRTARGNAVTSFVMVAYGASGDTATKVLALNNQLVANDIASRGLIWVNDGWWHCHDNDQDGDLTEVDDHPIRAELVARGIQLPDDSKPFQQVDVTEEPSAALLEAIAATELHNASQEQHQWVINLLTDPDPNPDDQRLGYLLGTLDTSIGLITALGAISRNNSARHLALWLRASHLNVPTRRAQILLLVGCAAWANGQGGTVNVVIEELDRLELEASSYQMMVELLRRSVTAPLPPSMWDEFSNHLMNTVLAAIP